MPDVRETIKRNVIAAVKALTRAADVQRTEARFIAGACEKMERDFRERYRANP